MNQPLTALLDPTDCRHYDSVPMPYSGPCLHIEKQKISLQVAIFKQALPDVTPHYAVKANPLPQVLRHLDALGVNFEIASLGELTLLKSLNIAPERIIFSNPIKSPASIKAAVQYGVQWFAFDNQEELIKLKKLAPDGKYELRIGTNGKGSVWPLTKKFGVDIKEAFQLIKFAVNNNMTISGLTFHVGSQCTQSDSWIKAINDCEKIINEMHESKMDILVLNIGGGFPCNLDKEQLTLKHLMQPVNKALKELQTKIDVQSHKREVEKIKVCAEPGRFLVASSGTLYCQVISTTIKKDQPWAFLDCGYYSGLMELTEDFGYTLHSSRKGKLVPWTIAGPTCDSIDCFKPKYQMPDNVQPEDIISISNMGAYAITCVTQFNGFDGPSVYVF